jgi:SNF2 family DNA or RNA helicase
LHKSLDCSQFSDPEEKQIVKAYKLSGEAKVEGIKEFIDTMIDNEIKFILFAHHHVVMDGLEAHLKQRLAKSQKGGGNRFDYIRIDGTTDQKVRN